MVKHNITCKQRAFDLLKAIYPDSMTTDRIGEASGMKTHDGARSTCSVLEREGRIKRVGRGTYVYNPEGEKAFGELSSEKHVHKMQPYEEQRQERPKEAPGAEQPVSDEPRDVVLFQAFLRPIGNEDKAWSNSLRLSKEFPEKRHDNIMQVIREVRDELSEVAALNFKDNTYTDALGRQRPMVEFSEDVLMPVVGRVGGKRASVGLHRLNQEFNRLKRVDHGGSGHADRQLLVDLFDRMDQRALEREDRTISLLKEMHDDARADRAMTQEALGQLMTLATRGPAPSITNVRAMEPGRYHGTFRGLPLMAQGISQTEMASTIAGAIGAAFGAGEFTVPILKDYIKEHPIAQIESDILPCGHRGDVPIPRPEYKEWFAFHDPMDLKAGQRPKWTWCFTVVGKRELLKPERLAHIKRWYLQRKGRLFA